MWCHLPFLLGKSSVKLQENSSSESACKVHVVYGNVGLDYRYIWHSPSWKGSAQKDTEDKERDKELGNDANPVLPCLLVALAMCKDTDALKLFAAASASSVHSQTPVGEDTDADTAQ